MNTTPLSPEKVQFLQNPTEYIRQLRNTPEYKQTRNEVIAGGTSGIATALALNSLDTKIVQWQTGKSKKLTRPQKIKTLVGKTVKGGLTTAIGYPVFMYTARHLNKNLIDENDPLNTASQKTASFAAAGNLAMRGFRALPQLGARISNNLQSWTRAGQKSMKANPNLPPRPTPTKSQNFWAGAGLDPASKGNAFTRSGAKGLVASGGLYMGLDSFANVRNF